MVVCHHDGDRAPFERLLEHVAGEGRSGVRRAARDPQRLADGAVLVVQQKRVKVLFVVARREDGLEENSDKSLIWDERRIYGPFHQLAWHQFAAALVEVALPHIFHGLSCAHDSERIPGSRPIDYEIMFVKLQPCIFQLIPPFTLLYAWSLAAKEMQYSSKCKIGRAHV